MIQRIQTIWLLLAALVMAGLFYTNVYRTETVQESITIISNLKVAAHFPSLILASLSILLSVCAIFLFKNRKRQKGIVWLAFLSALGFLAVNLMRISDIQNTPGQVNGTYQAGSLLPVLSLFFLILAIRGINKDEKLVRSLDRLR